MKPCEGTVFQIQRWSIHDGEGVRSTVFFKGCPLRCQWCANPESWESGPEILYFSDRCTACGRCTLHCEANANSLTDGSLIFNRAECTGCGQCAEICPAGARKKIGAVMSDQEVLQVVKRDAVFYRESGGGVTFSGGEPFYQAGFLRQLAMACRRSGIDTAVETSGYFDWDKVKDIFALLDFVFVDIKHMDDGIHRKVTGVGNERILENIIRISQQQPNTIVRVPLIEEINANDSNIRSMCEFLQRHTNVRGVELLPYHHLGEPKHSARGDLWQVFTAPAAAKKEAMQKIITSYGIEAADFK